MPEQRSRPKNGRVIALANQKGGTGKTTTTVNLGIGLTRLGKKVLLIDADPQGDLTTCLGWQDQDSLQTTLATVMGKIIRDEPFTTDEGILHHSEGVDLMPANIELSELEVSLVNAMSREVTLRTYVNEAKKNYDVVLIDCMPSLGMITINALAAADSVIIPVQAHYLPAKGMGKGIKTRSVADKTIKAIDKAAVASERMKEAYIRTKDKGEHGLYAEEGSPGEYASDRISSGVENTAREAVHQFDKQGRKGVKTTKENISKVKEKIQKRKAAAEQPKKQAEKQAARQTRQAADRLSEPVKTIRQERGAVKTLERGQKSIKTVDRSRKTIKQASSTAKGTVKTASKSIKTAEKTAKASIKTTQQAAKTAQKTAQATARAARAAAHAARVAAKAAVTAAKVAVKATIAAVKARTAHPTM